MLPKGTPIITTPHNVTRVFQEKQRQRQAMREYLIKERSNPFKSTGLGYIPDPAITRYEAAQTFASLYTHGKLTFKNSFFFMSSVIGPVLAIAFVSEYYRRTFDAKCRRGEISYAARNSKFT